MRERFAKLRRVLRPLVFKRKLSEYIIERCNITIEAFLTLKAIRQ